MILTTNFPSYPPDTESAQKATEILKDHYENCKKISASGLIDICKKLSHMNLRISATAVDDDQYIVTGVFLQEQMVVPGDNWQ